jgi:hypothetical protein
VTFADTFFTNAIFRRPRQDGLRLLLEHFWALILVIFSFAFTINEVLAWTERKISYYASSR